jgi:hypothetical protein
MAPDLFDVIELLVDVPEYALRSGARGAIVHRHSDKAYEVEFSNNEGEMIALCPLSADQFIVVWRAQTHTWLPLAEQLAAVVAHLAENDGREVLDFARFLHDRRQRQRAESPSETN